MPVEYNVNPEDELALLHRVVGEHYPLLAEHGVSFTVRMVSAERDDNGDIKSPAVKVHGWPCLATVKINSYSDRSQGKADVTLDVDADRWQDLNDERRVAMLCHELFHLEVTGKRDNLDRPKLKMRKHDFEIGGFVSIIERFQADAPEFATLADAIKQVRPVLKQQTMW